MKIAMVTDKYVYVCAIFCKNKKNYNYYVKIVYISLKVNFGQEQNLFKIGLSDFLPSLKLIRLRRRTKNPFFIYDLSTICRSSAPPLCRELPSI